MKLLIALTIAAFGFISPISAQDWIDHVKIPAADPAPWPEEFGAAEINIPCNSMSGRCDLDGYLQWQNICALYVLHDGKPALYRERSRKGACKSDRKRERYGVASITKSIVSLLYGEALTANPALAVDNPAADALAAIGVTYPRQDRTLRSLLRMSSGMEWNDEGPEAAVIRITESGAPGDPATLAKSVDSFLPTAQFSEKPGFNYSGFDTTLIGLVVDGGNRRLESLFTSRIWREIGAGHMAKWKADESKTPSPYCCLQMAPDDLAKIGQWALDALQDGGVRGAWMKASITDARPSNETCSVGGRLKPVGYGYQWWIPPSESGSFTAIGRGGQFLHVFPEQKVVIAQLSDDSGWRKPSHRCGAFHAHKAIADAVAK